MAQFDESKHPRDKDGKFTDGNGGNKSETEKRAELVKKYSSEPERDLREENFVSTVNTMSSQEWALWYKAVGENEKLGYWAEELPNGDAMLKVENNGLHKLVITGGTFEKPKAKAIYSFKNSDDLIDTMERIRQYGEKSRKDR